jgi:hypothetical protein
MEHKATWGQPGRSPLGTEMQGPTAAFKHSIQPDGSLLAELDDVVLDKMASKPLIQKQAIQPLDGSLQADDAVHNKMDGHPPIQAELKHQLGTQMAWWCFLDKTTPNIENQVKHTKWHNTLGDTWQDSRDAGHNTKGNTWHDARQGKDGKKVGDSSKHENWVFDPCGNTRLAEFSSMADAGKAALCLRSLPSEDVGFARKFPTETRADNAVQMATTQQPTHRTRHIDMKQICCSSMV